MQLECRVCRAVQPVSCPDEVDEDLRTQGIRRAFRAEHAASCGERSVFLEIREEVEASAIDEEAWSRYLGSITIPSGVTFNAADGFFYRGGARLCEDCWEPIPMYVDYPAGLTSPESDQLGKFRAMVAHEGKMGMEALRKAVCVPCYRKAYSRVYPGAALPELSETAHRVIDYTRPDVAAAFAPGQDYTDQSSHDAMRDHA